MNHLRNAMEISGVVLIAVAASYLHVGFGLLVVSAYLLMAASAGSDA